MSAVLFLLLFFLAVIFIRAASAATAAAAVFALLYTRAYCKNNEYRNAGNYKIIDK